MLTELLESARRRAAIIAPDEGRLAAEAALLPPARGFAAALSGDGLAVVAEVKRRSPSAGDIAPDLDAGAQARKYVDGGAAAISVLTEPEFFGGSLDDLRAAKASVDVPVLRKDFVVHSAQVWESRAAGADAILLIVAAVEQAELQSLLDDTRRAGLDALVEAHSGSEVERALDAGAEIVGVNNRDLRTFATDLGVAESVARLLPPAVVRVAESGVSSVEGAKRMAAAGYDAILVGEAAVRAADPSGFVSSLRRAAP
jgi:indole-3-glycerol phosphate synthase